MASVLRFLLNNDQFCVDEFIEYPLGHCDRGSFLRNNLFSLR